MDEKVRFGDLEIDTVIWKNHQRTILTINNRASSFLWMAKLNGKNAEELAKKVIDILKSRAHLLHTITGDNAKEFAEHKKNAEGINIDFYFARPYHSWERGADENMNGLIRQYSPKGLSFETTTNKDIKCVQRKLKNRPGKKLDFLSPIEFLLLKLPNKKVAFIT